MVPHHARVVVVHGRTAEVLADDADHAGGAGDTEPVRLAPGLGLTPVAGDEVVVAEGRIVEVLPRRTQLTRPDPNGHELQVLAANVDVVLLVAPAEVGQRGGALERMAIMAWDSGATPLVVLTKADLADDPDERVEQARSAAPGVEVVLTSTVDGRGLDALRSRLGPGTTATMLGASGRERRRCSTRSRGSTRRPGTSGGTARAGTRPRRGASTGWPPEARSSTCPACETSIATEGRGGDHRWSSSDRG